MRNPRRAGVIYVEALIVVPLLVALMMGTLYVGRSYDARIVAGQRAREHAWSAALPGCARVLVADDELLPSMRRVEQRSAGQNQVACNERALRGEP